MKKFIIVIIVIAGLCCCNRQSKFLPDQNNVAASCSTVSPIYFIGKIIINNPVVVKLDSILYITSENVLAENHANLAGRKDVFRYMTDSLFLTRYVPLYEPRIFYSKEIESIAEHSVVDEYNLTKCNSGQEYTFITPPECFVLLMTAETINEAWYQCDDVDLCDNNTIWAKFDTIMTKDDKGNIECKSASDEVLVYTFSDRYVPVVMAVYSEDGLQEVWKRNGLM